LTTGPLNDKGWLRKFYPPGSDDAHFDLTPAVRESPGLAWRALTQRAFVGTESRLLTVFELLRQMVRRQRDRSGSAHC
jgi:hypothetical protein